MSEDESVEQLRAAFPQLPAEVVYDVLAGVGWRPGRGGDEKMALAAEVLLGMTSAEDAGAREPPADDDGAGGGASVDARRNRGPGVPLSGDSRAVAPRRDGGRWAHDDGGGRGGADPGTSSSDAEARHALAVAEQIERDELLARQLQSTFAMEDAGVRDFDGEDAYGDGRRRHAGGEGGEPGTMYEDSVALVEGVVDSVAAGVNAIGGTLQSTWNALMATLPATEYASSDEGDEGDREEYDHVGGELAGADDGRGAPPAAGAGARRAPVDDGGEDVLTGGRTGPAGGAGVTRRVNVRATTADDRAEEALLTSAVGAAAMPASSARPQPRPASHLHGGGGGGGGGGFFDDKKKSD